MTDPISIHGCVVALFTAILGFAMVSDVESLRIPNRLCAALILLYPAHLLSAGAPVDWPAALLVAAAVFLVGLLPFSRGWMGGGDVKLMAAVALWMGPEAVLPFLMVMVILGGIIAALMLSRFRLPVARAAEVIGFDEVGEVLLGRSIPYGVAIALAGWIVGGPHLLAQGGLG
jgi:prepilin peptidase CpaA